MSRDKIDVNAYIDSKNDGSIDGAVPVTSGEVNGLQPIDDDNLPF